MLIFQIALIYEQLIRSKLYFLLKILIVQTQTINPDNVLEAIILTMICILYY